VLRNQELAASETTEIVLIDLSDRLSYQLPYAEAHAWTLSHAFRIAGARTLDIETREIGGMPIRLRTGWGIAVYDDVPGGAGHVLELLRDHVGWMDATLETMHGDDAHHRRCESACLDCLLTYDAQSAMERMLLRRKLAYDFLLKLRAGGPPPGSSGGGAWMGGAGASSGQPGREERLARAAALRAKSAGRAGR